jgi:hypothetical protein
MGTARASYDFKEWDNQDKIRESGTTLRCSCRTHFAINLRPNPSALDQTTFPWTKTSFPVLSGIFKVMICPVRTRLADLMKTPEGLISMV